MTKRKLNSDVAEKYRLIAIRPGVHEFKDFGSIDLTKLNVAEADALAARGFPYFVPWQKETVNKTKTEIKTNPPATTKEPVDIIPSADPPSKIPDQLRADKKLVNKLLTMIWPDLSENEKDVFFGSIDMFIQKKTRMIQNGDLQQEISSYHAKAKALDPDKKNDSERELLMTSINTLIESKKENWRFIDNWLTPVTKSPDTPDTIAAAALEKQAAIRRNTNYISRFSKIVKNMPETTAKEKTKKTKMFAEIELRKNELIALGAPYNRKPYKKK